MKYLNSNNSQTLKIIFWGIFEGRSEKFFSINRNKNYEAIGNYFKKFFIKFPFSDQNPTIFNVRVSDIRGPKNRKLADR